MPSVVDDCYGATQLCVWVLFILFMLLWWNILSLVFREEYLSPGKTAYNKITPETTSQCVLVHDL